MDPSPVRLVAPLDELEAPPDTRSEPHRPGWRAREGTWLQAGDGHGLTDFQVAGEGGGAPHELLLVPPTDADRIAAPKADSRLVATALRHELEP
jgi:hypothetical protein